MEPEVGGVRTQFLSNHRYASEQPKLIIVDINGLFASATEESEVETIFSRCPSIFHLLTPYMCLSVHVYVSPFFQPLYFWNVRTYFSETRHHYALPGALDTDDILRLWHQRLMSGSHGRRYLVNLIACELLKDLNQKLTQIPPTLGSQTD